MLRTEHAMGLLVGLLVIKFANALGFERDRSFYPTVLIVVTSYYLMFAAMGGHTGHLPPKPLSLAAS